MADPDDRDFDDNEAGEDEYPEGRKEKKRNSKFQDSSEEEEDEDQFENDGFIVDGEDDEEADVGDVYTDEPPEPAPRSRGSSKRKRRRRSLEDDDELDEEDLRMLEEQGLSVKSRRKLRRLKKAAAPDDDDEGDYRYLSDDGRGDDDGDNREAVDEDVDDVDEFDDFIDDGGRSRRRRKAQPGGVNSEAVRAARNVFGSIGEIKMGFKAARRESAASGLRTPKNRRGRGYDDDDEDEDYVDGDDRRKSRMDDESEDGLDSEDDGLQRLRKGGRVPRRSPKRQGGADEEHEASVAEAASGVAARMSISSGVHLGAEEAAVIDKDVPERLQSHLAGRPTVTKEEIASESVWIFQRGFARNPAYQGIFDPDAVVKKIGQVLEYIHEENLDIPFIAMYRKDYVAPELLWACGGDPDTEPRAGGASFGQASAPQRPKGFNSLRYDDYDEAFGIEHLRGVEPGYDDACDDWTALWTVLDWDKKWADLVSRRNDVVSLTEASADKGVPEHIIRRTLERIRECDDDIQLADLDRFVRLATEAALALQTRDDAVELGRHNPDVPPKPEAPTEGRRRPTSRANKYGEYHRKGYGLLAAKFGIEAVQIAENLEGALEYGEFQLHYPKEAEADPQEMATMVGKDLQDAADLNEAKPQRDTLIEANPQRLLEAARYLLCREILAEPRILAVARKMLQMETVLVTARVTNSGRVAVHESHHLRPYVHVRDKPVYAFRGTPDFAFMRQAASKGYCDISLKFQSEYEHRFRSNLEKSVVVGMVDEHCTIQKWNTERRIMADEVGGMIVKALLDEAETELEAATGECMETRLHHAACRRMMVGPARPFPKEDGAPRVLAVSVTHEEDEDPDPAQIAKDEEVAKTTKGIGALRRPSGARVTFVNLDRNGAYVNSEEVFGKWLQRPIREREPPTEVFERLTAYLSKCRPELIVIGIGSGGKDAIRLRGDLIDVTAKMLKDGEAGFLVGDEVANSVSNSNSIELENMYPLVEHHIIAVPEDAARLHCDTIASGTALPIDLMTRVEKRAIALGRLAQEPLSVYAAIGAEDDVAARLELNRLHFLVKPKRRIEALRRALVRAVCVRGVDVNRLLMVPHTQPMLNFVGGLGTIKARALVRKIEQTVGDEETHEEEEDRYLPSRKHLFADSFLGRCVFMSAAGFLRIRDPNIHPGGSTTAAARLRKECLARKNRSRRRDDDGSREFFDPLDDSRIHPENYVVAVKIADEALRDESGELKVDNVDTAAASAGARLVAIVLQNPEGLTQLDLEMYADHLEKLGRGKLYETIKMVAREFQASFKDMRAPLRTPTPRAEFFIATGADPIELRVGGEITATQCQVAKSKLGISCRLPYNLRGFVTKLNFSDDPNLSGIQMAKLVSPGSDLPCRILAFNYEAFELKLTSRPKLLLDSTLIPGHQEAYDTSSEYILEYDSGPTVAPEAEGRPASRGAEDKRLGPRAAHHLQRAQEVVKHDFYHEMTADSAIVQLRNAAPGEVIIRPSTSKVESDQFVFTAKFADAAKVGGKDPSRGIVHILCKVKNAGATDGSTLYDVGGEEYGSVDEALETFVSPVVTNMGEAMESRKYRAHTPSDMEKMIKEEKSKAIKSIPYFFGLPEKRPLYLLIFYMPGKHTVHHELIKVVPDGFQFRNVLHTTLDLLASWFKKNLMKTGPVSAPSSRIRASPYVAAGRSTPVMDPSVENPIMAVATPLVDVAPPPMPVPSGIGVGAASGIGVPSGARTPSPPRGIVPIREEPPVPISYMARLQPDTPPPPPPSSPPRLGDARPMPGQFNDSGFGRGIPPPPPPSYNGGWNGGSGQPNGSWPAPGRGNMNGPPPFNSRGSRPGPGRRGPGPQERDRGIGMGRGRGGDDASARRGQRPVPAWKKAMDEKAQRSEG